MLCYLERLQERERERGGREEGKEGRKRERGREGGRRKREKGRGGEGEREREGGRGGEGETEESQTEKETENVKHYVVVHQYKFVLANNNPGMITMPLNAWD